MALIFVAMLFVSADKNQDSTELVEVDIKEEVIVTEEVTEPQTDYISNMLGLFSEGELNIYMDEIEILFDKFEVKYELRDYIRQLCEIYNVPVTLAISVAQIETHNGTIKNYDVRADYRMYYTWNKKTETYIETWDLGYFQMNDSYSDYWEECFYNPELIFSLGYSRYTFDLTDDMINIQIGIAYIDYLLKYFKGDQTRAVWAFNTGMGNVNKGNIPDLTYAYEHAIRHNWKYREKDA
jgi:hypothetical protein